MRKTNKDMGILQIGVNCIFETKNGWRNTLWTNLLASPIVGIIKHWWKMKWQNAIIWTSDKSVSKHNGGSCTVDFCLYAVYVILFRGPKLLRELAVVRRKPLVARSIFRKNQKNRSLCPLAVG